MRRGHLLSKPAAALATRVTAYHAPLHTRVAAASSSLTAVRRATRALSSTAQPPPPDDAKAKDGAGAASEGAAAEPGAEGAAAADYTKELEARIAELQQQLEGKHDQVLRSLAEAENARRRAKIDVEEAHKFAVGKFAKELIGVADTLKLAQDAVPVELRASDEHPQLKALYEGVVMTETVLQTAFSKHGLKKIWPMDEKFDPKFHDALFEMPSPDKVPGTVAHVASAGYVLHERCIRPAAVGIVSKP